MGLGRVCQRTAKDFTTTGTFHANFWEQREGRTDLVFYMSDITTEETGGNELGFWVRFVLFVDTMTTSTNIRSRMNVPLFSFCSFFSSLGTETTYCDIRIAQRARTSSESRPAVNPR